MVWWTCSSSTSGPSGIALLPAAGEGGEYPLRAPAGRARDCGMVGPFPTTKTPHRCGLRKPEIAFPMPPSDAPRADLRLLAVLAHPDDETLGLGGLLARCAAEGVATYVVTATHGQS